MAVAGKTDRRKDSTPTPSSREAGRTNAALRAGGIDCQVGPDGSFDAKAFADAALKRWPRVMAKLGE